MMRQRFWFEQMWTDVLVNFWIRKTYLLTYTMALTIGSWPSTTYLINRSVANLENSIWLADTILDKIEQESYYLHVYCSDVRSSPIRCHIIKFLATLSEICLNHIAYNECWARILLSVSADTYGYICSTFVTWNLHYILCECSQMHPLQALHIIYW